MIEMGTYLSSLETAKGNRKAAMANLEVAKREYTEAFTPLLGFPTDEQLTALMNMCKGNDCYSRSDIFICVSLLLFNPEGLYDGKIRVKLAKAIAKTLGVTHYNIYLVRKKIIFWLELYPSFYRAVEEVYKKYESII